MHGMGSKRPSWTGGGSLDRDTGHETLLGGSLDGEATCRHNLSRRCILKYSSDAESSALGDAAMEGIRCPARKLVEW